MKLFTALIVVLSLIACTWALGPFNIDRSKISVSGLSAGGFMAVQYQVAFSSEVMGAGIIAGGPFYCAEGQMWKASSTCMSVPLMLDVNSLVASTKKFESNGEIDATSNLKNHKVWLFSGKSDSVVNPGVMDKLVKYYEAFMPSTNIETLFTEPAQHSFITNDYGNACSYLGTPFINNCNVDGAAKILTRIYGPLNAAVTPVASNIVEYDQAKVTGLAPKGYAYVPTACKNGAECALHIAFHGCSQSYQVLGDKYYTNTGYNKWAESNNIIVIYPQATSSILSNPNGCFDWWGYAGSNYYSKNGAQLAAINGFVKSLMK